MKKLKIDPQQYRRFTRGQLWTERAQNQKKYYDDLRILAKMAGVTFSDGIFNAVFRVKMPKSWPNKKKAEMIGKPHLSTPDLDNFVKSTLDAICVNDSHVYKITAEKFWSDQGCIEIY